MISIVIATLGRQSLRDSVESIKLDFENSRIDFELLIVVDGVELDSSLEDYLNSCYFVKIFKLPKNFGPSFAFNFGISKAVGTIISVFSDDDNWLLGRSILIKNFFDLNLACVLFTQSLVVDEQSELVRPSDQIYFADFLNDHYSKPFRVRNPKTILMTTVAAKSEVWRRVKFNQNLRSHEDLLWIHEVSRAGFKIHLIEKVTVKSFNSINRSYERVMENSFDWPNILFEINPRLASSYIFRHLPKLFAFRGDLINIFSLRKKIDLFSPNYLDLAFMTFWGFAASIIKFSRFFLGLMPRSSASIKSKMQNIRKGIK